MQYENHTTLETHMIINRAVSSRFPKSFWVPLTCLLTQDVHASCLFVHLDAKSASTYITKQATVQYHWCVDIPSAKVSLHYPLELSARNLESSYLEHKYHKRVLFLLSSFIVSFIVFILVAVCLFMSLSLYLSLSLFLSLFLFLSLGLSLSVCLSLSLLVFLSLRLPLFRSLGFSLGLVLVSVLVSLPLRPLRCCCHLLCNVTTNCNSVCQSS